MSPDLAGGWQTPSQACCDLAEPVHWNAYAQQGMLKALSKLRAAAGMSKGKV